MADEEAQARVDVWKYAYGSITTRVIKTAIDLDIPELLENCSGGAPISLSDLSSAVGCQPQTIYRIMRFLIYHGMFRRIKGSHKDDDIYYTQSPLSRLFMKKYLGPVIGMTNGILKAGPNQPVLEVAITGDYNKFWGDIDCLGSSKFTEAMAAHARVTTSAIIENYAEGFRGIGSVVDVGGRHGITVSMLVKAFPWVRGICFDLPEVVVRAPPIEGVEFVGGTMFKSIPRADAVILMWILHDWSDEECIKILKKCKEAVLPEGTGKVMIVEAVVDEDDEERDEHKGARLALDMLMMAETVTGKERTYGEWKHVLNAAGFSRHNVININTVESLIEAYP